MDGYTKPNYDTVSMQEERDGVRGEKKEFSPSPISSPLKGEEIVFKEGACHALWAGSFTQH
jgi:hypothetical protein